MADSPVAHIEAAIKAAKERLRLNPDFRLIEELEGALKRYSPGATQTDLAPSPVNAQDYNKMLTSIQRPKPPSQKQAAIDALIQADRPLSIDELVPLVEKTGALISGNKNINLSSALSKDERFVSLKSPTGSRWWLKGMPYLDPQSRLPRVAETPVPPAETNSAPPKEGEAVN